MSTKIYNGHEVVGHTLESILPELQKLREPLQAIRQRLIAKAVVGRAVRMLDRQHLGMRTFAKGSDFLTLSQNELNERMEKLQASPYRDPEVDFKFEVCLIPVEGRLLAITYTEQSEFSKLWAAQPWRKDFSYWNSTEAPDSVSDEEWGAREALWAKAFGKSWVPGEVGLSYDFMGMSGYPFVRDADVAEHVGTREERAKRLHLEYLEFERKQRGMPDLTAISQLLKLERSDEGLALLEDLTARLPSDISPDALRQRAVGEDD